MNINKISDKIVFKSLQFIKYGILELINLACTSLFSPDKILLFNTIFSLESIATQLYDY